MLFGALATLAVVLTLSVSPAIAGIGIQSSSQTVTGTSLGVLAITAVPVATFTTGFEAGDTATTTGVLTLIDTEPSWSLSVQDEAGADPGHMVAAALGCEGSESELEDPLDVEVTSALGKAHSAGTVGIDGEPQTVSSATNQILSANIFTANYSQKIEPFEALRTGCIYSMTATYTLQ
jgi:hypothetical protein